MSDLTWLAENVSEWCQDAKWLYRMGQEAFFSWSVMQCPTSFTRAQWQAERERLGLDKPAWNGEGLPPVGVECEFYSDRPPLAPEDCTLEEACVVDTWKTGDRLKVIAVVEMPHFPGNTGWTPVVQNARTHQVSTLMLEFIRPLRTQEQREREESIRALEAIVMHYDDSYEAAAAAYDAGWRKQS